MGALPQLRAAADVNVKAAEYYGPGGFTEMKGNPVVTKALPHAHKLDDAKRLWKLSEELTSVKF